MRQTEIEHTDFWWPVEAWFGMSWPDIWFVHEDACSHTTIVWFL